jgi:hypothetical protein
MSKPICKLCANEKCCSITSLLTSEKYNPMTWFQCYFSYDFSVSVSVTVIDFTAFQFQLSYSYFFPVTITVLDFSVTVTVILTVILPNETHITKCKNLYS